MAWRAAGSPLVAKRSPATTHATRHSYLSLTSAGVASDLPFVTLHGNKQGLARVGEGEKNQNKSEGCCSPSRVGGRSPGWGMLRPQPGRCVDLRASGSRRLPARATSAVQRGPAGFGSLASNQAGELLPTERASLPAATARLCPTDPPAAGTHGWQVTPATLVSGAAKRSRAGDCPVLYTQPRQDGGAPGAATHRGMAGMRVPFSSTKCPPALRTQQWCRDIRACRAVVGLSLPFWLSAFFRGENSSSRSTSYTTNFLGEDGAQDGQVGETQLLPVALASPLPGWLSRGHGPPVAHPHGLVLRAARGRASSGLPAEKQGHTWRTGRCQRRTFPS